MTRTDISNRALSVLGHDRTINDFDTDESTEALRCRQFFDAALEDVLCSHNWDFAAVEISLRLTACDASGYARMPIPGDCLHLVGATDAQGNPLKIRRIQNAILVQTNGREATIRYITRDVDIETLPHKFREALVYKLASLICAPMFGNDKKTEGYTNLAQMKLGEAITAEADETAFHGAWEDPFISARR